MRYLSISKSDTRWVLMAKPDKPFTVESNPQTIVEAVEDTIERWWTHDILRLELTSKGIEVHVLPPERHREANGGKLPLSLQYESYEDVDFTQEERHAVPR